MKPALFGHPFSSYTQKVLIALHENDIDFEFRDISPDHPDNATEWLRLWPIAKLPVWVDGNETVAETSIIIEHVQLTRPGSLKLVPEEPRAALDVRFLDRFFDSHVMTPMQHAVNGALTGKPDRRDEARAHARERLEVAYAWLERILAGRTWAAGQGFSLADCAAAPSLFYADWTHAIDPEKYPALRAYRARLLARPSVARAVDGGRPHRHLFPLGAPDRD